MLLRLAYKAVAVAIPLRNLRNASAVASRELESSASSSWQSYTLKIEIALRFSQSCRELLSVSSWLEGYNHAAEKLMNSEIGGRQRLELLSMPVGPSESAIVLRLPYCGISCYYLHIAGQVVQYHGECSQREFQRTSEVGISVQASMRS